MYDFTIIGGGIIGASTAMQLIEAYPDSKILLLEKESGVAQHQTGNNSGVIHAGIYYTPGTLKADFCIRGNKATKAFCQQWDIPYKECGKLLVATNALEMQRMQVLYERAQENGIERYLLDQKELNEREPNIQGLGAIFVPSSGIVDYKQVTQTMIQRFQSLGGEVRLNTPIVGIEEHQNYVTLRSGLSSGLDSGPDSFKTRFNISCSGLMSDRIVSMLGLKPSFKICPFRGEYYSLPEQHKSIVEHLIYPVPDSAVPFLGVHLTPMINGDITVGPNAVLALKREGYRKTDVSLADTLETFTHLGTLKVLKKNFVNGVFEMKNSLFKGGYLKQVQKYCPSIKKQDLLPYPAGVRAQAVSNEGELIDDFLFVSTLRTFNVCNAPSPAATSAIPIGEHIINSVNKHFDNLENSV